MNPIEVGKLMFLLLPVWILEAGFKKLNAFLSKEEGRWDTFLYFLTMALCLVTLGLILDGHPIR